MQSIRALKIVASIVVLATSGSAQEPDFPKWPPPQGSIRWLTETSQSEPGCSPIIQQILDPLDIPGVQRTGSVRASVSIDVDGRIASHNLSDGPAVLTDPVRQAISKWSGESLVAKGSLPAPRTLAIEIDFKVFRETPPVSVAFPSVETRQQVVIRLERYGCLGGRCPSYKLTIRGDGTVEYEGLGHVLLLDKHSGRISNDRFDALVEAFRASDYFSLDSEYEYPLPTEVLLKSEGCVKRKRAIYGAPTHARTTVTSIQVGQRSKRVVNTANTAPKEVIELEESIDRLVRSEQWVTGNEDTITGLLAGGTSLDGKTLL